MILVAGHICLDIIPRFESPTQIEPGKLIEVGAADITTGGCVANVGRALHRLGVETKLAGKVGDDTFGDLTAQILKSEDPKLADGLVVSKGGTTSYSVVISPPGIDRTFLHMPGENNAFTSEDLEHTLLKKSEIVHFGYPSLMAKMFENEGAELERVLTKIKSAGAKTSLDLSLPDPNSAAGKAPWQAILTKCLPLVDYFFPGEDELAFMLPHTPAESYEDQCLELGAKAVVVKRGSRGISVADDQGRKASHPCFKVEMAGTTGAGDATIAGYLMAVSMNFEFEKCLEAACAVGASSVESVSATDGILSWPELEARISAGWAKV